MKYINYEDTYVLRLEKNEEVVESIKKLCKEEKIILAEITGLGAANLVEIGLFNVNTKEYRTEVIEGMFEITSLIGNATTKEEEPYLHLHINFSDASNQVKGGHLVRANISATGEIFIRKIAGKVGRRFDEEIGLNLLNI